MYVEYAHLEPIDDLLGNNYPPDIYPSLLLF